MALQLHVESARRPVPPREDPYAPRIALRPSAAPAFLDDGLSQAVFRADAAAAPADLAALWQDFMDQRLQLDTEVAGPARRFVFARVSGDPAAPRTPLNRLETAVLVRVLCGEQQKVIAAELGIACSTASKWYTLALSKLRLDRRPIPLSLIIAAQAWGSGQTPAVAARSAALQYEGCPIVFLSVPRPQIAETPLTHAEQEVAKLLIEGASRWDIAERRATSAQTVACQLRGIFSKFHLTGRYALCRRAVELGWFR